MAEHAAEIADDNTNRLNKVDRENELTKIQIGDISKDNDKSMKENKDRFEKLEKDIINLKSQLKQVNEVEKTINTIKSVPNNSKTVPHTPNEEPVFKTLNNKTTKNNNKKEEKENNKNSDLNEDTKNQIKEGRMKIGIYPFTLSDITNVLDKDMDLTDVPDEIIYKDPTFGNARVTAAIRKIEEHFFFKEGELSLNDAKMANNPYSKILWLTMDEMDVKKIYLRASQVRSKSLFTRDYTPQCVWFRKNKIIDHFKELRKHNNIRYQIRLGEEDLIVLTKVIGESNWSEVDINSLKNIPNIQTISKSKQVPRDGHVYIGSNHTKRLLTPDNMNSKKK